MCYIKFITMSGRWLQVIIITLASIIVIDYILPKLFIHLITIIYTGPSLSILGVYAWVSLFIAALVPSYIAKKAVISIIKDQNTAKKTYTFTFIMSVLMWGNINFFHS